MKIIQLIDRNLSVRKLSSVLTTLGVALGVMLVSAILQLKAEMHDSYMRPGKGYSMVVGGPGSPLQLVMGAVYHVDKPAGLMPLSAYDDLRQSRSVAGVVPYALGDSFRRFRVVGTTDEFFGPAMPHPAGTKLAQGRAFAYDRAVLDQVLAGTAPTGGVFEAVIGAEVASELGIGVGDVIEPAHGIGDGASEHSDEQTWNVVGVLRRDDTPVDDLVLINLDSFYRIRDHQGGFIAGTGEAALSVVLVFPKAGMHKGLLMGSLRKRTDVQVADVQAEIQRLFRLVGGIDKLLLLISWLVVVIGIMSITVAIYNSMAERKVEIATLRAIGAGRRFVFAMVLGEATMLAATGGLVGILLGHGLVAVIGPYLDGVAGLSLQPWRLVPSEALVLLAVLFVGAMAGTLPAWKAYRTDVASSLSGPG